MDPLTDLIGKSAAAEDLRTKVARLFQRRHGGGHFPPILIEGETGTGKGLVARLIHRAGPRADGPFMPVNCAAIPETLLESELFGFERGAFTDARRSKRGLFQSAHRGVLFLDEIGRLPAGVQAKLLTAIEERWVRALGRTDREEVDVWIVAATNVDLADAVRHRQFREDLYHRLAVLRLHVPSLRERREDILLLAEHFLELARREYDLPERRLTGDARAALVAYAWPGNIRELANVMERVAVLSETTDITAAMLGLSAGPRATVADDGEPMEETIATLERRRILDVLEQTAWNVTDAAQRLGLTRNKLRYRIDKYRLARGAPPRRPVARGRSSAHATPDGAAPAEPAVRSAPPRRDRRRLTMLRAAVLAGDAAEPPLAVSAATALFREKVETFGGRVELGTGDGIAAVFGVEPVDDAARRAVHTAMAIRRAVAQLDGLGDTPPDVRMAIHVADFLVDFDDAGTRMDADSTRRATAVCDALVERAAPGGIMVSEQAARFVERRFAVVTTRSGLRLVGHERSGVGVAGRMTRFVGRDEDLKFVQSRIAVMQRGHAQVLAIAGPAGIGKSRLLRELRQSLRGQPITVLRGQCVPSGESTPHFLVLQILRQALRVSDADPAGRVTERVWRTLRDLDVDVACQPYLLRLLGVREGVADLAVLSDEAIRTGTLDVLRQMLLSGSQVQPVVCMTEDLHWVDKASEDFVASLVESLADARILLLATYRPGYRPPWVARSYATQIALQPLSDTDSLALVRSISAGAALPEPLARAIVDRAEGNPFFLEELTRVGWDRDGQGEPAIPDTVEDVVRARLDRLPDAARTFLQTVAVLGREFSATLAARLCGASVEAELAELVRVEFLREQRLAGERLYAFKHVLMHDVAYEAIPPDERRALHANAARAVSEVYGERVAEAYDQLAYHYSKADDHPRAVEYLTLAAERAARVYAHEESVRALQQALRHATRLPAAEHTEPLIDLALRLAASLIPLGRFQEALDVLLQHEDALERLDRPALAGRYYFLVGRAASFLGSYDRAASAAQRAITEATRAGDVAIMGKAYSVLAMDAPMSGQTRQGIDFAQRAIALLDGTTERWWLGHTHWALGLNYTQTGDFVAGLEAEGKAYAIGEAIGDPRLQAYASWVTGLIYAVAGEAAAGVEACRRALDRAPDPFNREIARGFLGYAHLEHGDTDDAIALLERAIRRLGEFRYRPFQGWFSVFHAEALRQAQQPDKAGDVARQGLVICRDSGFQIGVGWAQQVLGRIAHQRGHLTDAATFLARARDTFTEIQSRYELARTFVDAALVAHAAGDTQGAAEHLNAAHQLFVVLHVPKCIERVARVARELGVPLRAQV